LKIFFIVIHKYYQIIKIRMSFAAENRNLIARQKMFCAYCMKEKVGNSMRKKIILLKKHKITKELLNVYKMQ